MFHVKSHRTERKTERHLICMTNTLLVSARTQHFAVTVHQGHVRQRNPIKFYQYLPGAKIKPFMLSLQCVLDLCPGVSLWGVSSSAEIKEALGEKSHSVVFCLSVKYIQRGWRLSKQLKSMKRKWTPHAKQLAPDPRDCMHVNMCVWPVGACRISTSISGATV